MYQTQVNPFELSKRKISESSGKIAKLLIAVVALLFVLIILVMIMLAIAGGSSVVIDPSNPYAAVSAMFSSFIVLGIFILLIALAFIVIQIMVLVQYYKLGQGFSEVANMDPSLPNAKNISFGIYGYIIGYVLGLIIPGTFGKIMALLGTFSLAAGFYFIYETFEDFRKQGRFGKPASKKLFIAVAFTLIGNIMNFVNSIAMIGVGGFFGLIGFILLIIGLKDLERDILLVTPTETVPTQLPTQTPYQAPTSVPTSPAPEQSNQSPQTQDATQAKFCPNCGTKNELQDKFCISCGTKLD
ncbi:MAG: zinc-ribbon domain-containing protein [Candidatus Heimdallarchaeaceae archaeon]